MPGRGGRARRVHDDTAQLFVRRLAVAVLRLRVRHNAAAGRAERAELGVGAVEAVVRREERILEERGVLPQRRALGAAGCHGAGQRAARLVETMRRAGRRLGRTRRARVVRHEQLKLGDAREMVGRAAQITHAACGEHRFGFSAKRTLILPGDVRYELDLAKLQAKDVTWDNGSNTLRVTLPEIEIAAADPHVAHDSGRR